MANPEPLTPTEELFWRALMRITLTLPVLNNAAVVMFLAAGEDKAETLKEVLEGQKPGDQFPSKLVRPADGQLIWLVDRAAAKALSSQRS